MNYQKELTKKANYTAFALQLTNNISKAKPPDSLLQQPSIENSQSFDSRASGSILDEYCGG